MKEEIREVLGYKVPMLVYETTDEGDKAAGKAGAVLAEANNNLLYRGTYAEARSLIWDIVEELTGVEPIKKPTDKKDSSGAVVMEITEKDKQYVERALAQAAADGKPVTAEQIQSAIDSKARGYTFTDEKGVVQTVPPLAADITQRVRVAPKPKKLGEEYKTRAGALLDAGKTDALFELFQRDLGKVPTLTGDRTKDVDAIGWFLKEHIAFRQAQQLAQYQNLG